MTCIRKCYRRFKVYLPTLLLCLSASCRPVVYAIYGIKKPHPVSTAYIVKKANKLNLEAYTLYGIRPEKYPAVINRISTLPNVVIYDKHRQALNWKKSEDACKAGVADFIAQLRGDSNANFTSDTTFREAENELVGLHDGKPLSLQDFPKADYYVFVYWATFLGRLNREYLTDWLAATQRNRQASFHFVFVTGDLRKEWGEEYWKNWSSIKGEKPAP